MPKSASIVFGGILPHRDDEFFHGAKSFIFRNASIRYSAHPVLQYTGVVFFGEIAIIRKIFIAVVRYQAKERFFQVGDGGGQAMNNTLADSRRQSDAELGGGHSSGYGKKHLASFFQVSPISDKRVAGCSRIEILVIFQYKFQSWQLGIHSSYDSIIFLR